MQKQNITHTEFNGYVSKICRDIVVSNWRPDIIVGICRGGALPAVMISQYFDIPCAMLNISLRDFPELTCHDLALSDDAFSGKKILVVDDINDSGATLNWLMEDWQSSCMPTNEKWHAVWNHNVKFAVIVDNLSSDCKVAIDYTGFEINKAERDVWINFPYEEWWT